MTATVSLPLRRVAAAAALASLLAGCGWLTEWATGTDNATPPAPLVSIATAAAKSLF